LRKAPGPGPPTRAAFRDARALSPAGRSGGILEVKVLPLLEGTKEARMYRLGKPGKPKDPKRKDRINPAKPYLAGGREVIRRSEQFRIAPKHPGMGRK
jgi:hypothetical protein